MEIIKDQVATIELIERLLNEIEELKKENARVNDILERVVDSSYVCAYCTYKHDCEMCQLVADGNGGCGQFKLIGIKE